MKLHFKKGRLEDGSVRAVASVSRLCGRERGAFEIPVIVKVALKNKAHVTQVTNCVCVLRYKIVLMLRTKVMKRVHIPKSLFLHSSINILLFYDPLGIIMAGIIYL